MNIFIVGGTGFLGYHSALEFLRRGDGVTAFGLPPIPQDDAFLGNVRVIVRSLEQTSDDELCNMMGGHDALVFAAGADDRFTPRRPAFPYFHHGNVETTRRVLSLAKQAGIRRAVVLGSYFVHFDRLLPELKLALHHPYIHSRVEQEDVCRELSVPGFDVMVLELPYIFGGMPNRIPLWTPLIKYIRSSNRLLYMRGGSACVSVQTVAEAVVGAVKQGSGGGVYPIGEENLTWDEMLERLGQACGRHVRVIHLPAWMLSIAGWSIWLSRRLQGREGGLDMRYFAPLQTACLFFDPLPAQKALGFHVAGLESAFKDTVYAAGV